MSASNLNYQKLISNIADSYSIGQKRTVQFVNTSLLQTYWEIGRHIILFEQEGSLTAEYGKRLLETLSKDLTKTLGKGFSRSNLNHMRQLFKHYPICEKLSHKLDNINY